MTNTRDMGKMQDNIPSLDKFSNSVNVLGVPAFSEHIGDFEEEGTRVSSCGKISTLIWDHHKYSRTFIHPDSSLPEMSVNNGFSSFHKLCNFVSKVNPFCFKWKKKKKKKKEPILAEDQTECPYEVGEEIIFKNGDHVEKGVIEEFKQQLDNNYPLFSIQFSDNREAETHFDQRVTNDETDAGQIPITTEELIEQCKHALQLVHAENGMEIVIAMMTLRVIWYAINIIQVILDHLDVVAHQTSIGIIVANLCLLQHHRLYRLTCHLTCHLTCPVQHYLAYRVCYQVPVQYHLSCQEQYHRLRLAHHQATYHHIYQITCPVQHHLACETERKFTTICHAKYNTIGCA